MSKRQLNFAPVETDDGLTPDVTVKLNFAPVDNTADIVAHQREKFGGGDVPPTHEPAVALSGEPGSLFMSTRGGVPTVNPRALLEAGKTGASDLAGLVTVPLGALLHPKDTAEALGQIREQQETQAGQEWQRGDYPSAIRRGALNMVPFGPSANAMLDESAVDPAKGLGHAAAAAVAPEASKVLESPLASAKTAMTKIGALADEGMNKLAGQGTAKEMMVQAVKPYVRRTNFTQNLDRSMPHVAAAAEANDIPLDGLDNMMQAVSQAKKMVRSQFEQIMGGRPIRVDLTPVADEMVDSISAKTRREDPAKVKEIEALADKYRATVPADEAEELLKNTNAELEAYYNKYPAARSAAVNKNPDTAVIDAQGRALRKQLYDAMDPAGKGGAPRELQRDYGALMELEQEGFRRHNVMKRQAPESLSQQAAKWNATGRVIGGLVGGVGGLATGGDAGAIIGGLAGEAGGAFAQAKMADWLRKRNSTDDLIRRAFEGYDTKPKPVSMNSGQLALPAVASPSVIPQEATGAAAPGSTSAQSQWQRPESFQMPVNTGVGRDVTTGQMRRMSELDMEKYLTQERNSGRLNLATRAAPEESPIDAEILKLTPSPRAPIPSRGPIAAQASGLPPRLALPVGSGQQAGRTVIPAGESFTTKDINGLQNAAYDIARDPKTGRFKKVYKSTPVEEKKP